MKVIVVIFFYVFSVFSVNIFAAEIYQCKTSEGKVAYSDKQCANTESQAKVDFKNISWTRSLDASKPVGTKIIEVTQKKEDTIIKYSFHHQDQLRTFMRSAQQLSSMNVNLLKYKAPKNGAPGEASLMVTTKKGILTGKIPELKSGEASSLK